MGIGYSQLEFTYLLAQHLESPDLYAGILE